MSSMDKTDMQDGQSAPLLGSAPTPRISHDRLSRRTLCIGLAGLAAIVVTTLALSHMLDLLRRPSPDPKHPFGLSTNVARNLGLYSPWQPAAAASDYSVPRGCVVTQVNVVRQGSMRSRSPASCNDMDRGFLRSMLRLGSLARWNTCVLRHASTARSRSCRTTNIGSSPSCLSRPVCGSAPLIRTTMLIGQIVHRRRRNHAPLHDTCRQ